MKRVAIMNQDDYDEVMRLINDAIEDLHRPFDCKDIVVEELVKAREILWNDEF